MTKTLLIGGLGYIDSTLVSTLLESLDDHTVMVPDPLLHDVDPRHLHSIVSSDRVHFAKGDVSNIQHALNMVRRTTSRCT